MTVYPPACIDRSEFLSSIQIPDFEVSWAGDFPYSHFFSDRLRNRSSVSGYVGTNCPTPVLYCFGSEDGRVIVTDITGKPRAGPAQLAQSHEAINGIAFLGGFTAISTRDEIMLWLPQLARGARIPLGAHDIIAGANGYFFASLGRQGLMACQPTAGEKIDLVIYRDDASSLYYYRTISLRTGDGKELLVSALRTNGVGVVEFHGGDQPHQLSWVTFAGLDVIDLCVLDSTGLSSGVVALGRDGTIILFNDVLNDRHPTTIKYEEITGTAYRVFRAHGYLFVLTSDGLHVIFDLVDRFNQGIRDTFPTRGWTLKLEAVDAFLVSDEWLLIILPDEVLRLDITMLGQYVQEEKLGGKLRGLTFVSLSPAWQWHQVEQRPAFPSVA